MSAVLVPQGRVLLFNYWVTYNVLKVGTSTLALTSAALTAQVAFCPRLCDKRGTAFACTVHAACGARLAAALCWLRMCMHACMLKH